MKKTGVVMITILSLAGWACSRPSIAGPAVPNADQDLQLPPDAGPQTTVLAGGCFWCTEAVFEQLQGVKEVVSGYAGGTPQTANYRDVSMGTTNHAEAIQIVYDPARISYGQLLRVFFSVAHDPTQLNRQGPDSGRQYRSAVFYKNDDEKRVAQAYIAQLEAAKLFERPIVTTLEPLTAFHLAEKSHQDFVRLNPDHPYVVRQALPKVKKVRRSYEGKVKP